MLGSSGREEVNPLINLAEEWDGTHGSASPAPHAPGTQTTHGCCGVGGSAEGWQRALLCVNWIMWWWQRQRGGCCACATSDMGTGELLDLGGTSAAHSHCTPAHRTPFHHWHREGVTQAPQASPGQGQR